MVIALVLFGLVSSAGAQGITAVGPASGPLGYPQWIEASNGVKLELCVDTNGFCTPPADGEGFWWTATADAPALVPQGNSLLVLAWEAAYGGDGEPVDGNQMAFARLRIRVDVPVAGTYTVIHPYGTKVFENVTVADGINYTEDIGGFHPVRVAESYQGLLAAFAAPALVWDDYLTNPALLDPVSGARYVGDNGTAHAVTGSPTVPPQNFFRIIGPVGSAIDVQTADFVVMGKLDTGAAPTAWTFPPPPPQNLATLGAINRVTPFKLDSLATVTGELIDGYPVGYPTYYQDTNNLQLTVCPGGDPMCLSEPPDPADPNSVALNMGGEAFYWSAEADAIGGGIEGLLVLAVEAAFGGDGAPKDGNQMVFARIRIRIDTPVAGTYTITHPFGTKTFTNVPAGRRAINYTEDIGGANPIDPDFAMDGVLYGKLGPYLTWPNYVTDPHLAGIFGLTGVRYVGDPAVPHVVTGSPTGNNFFRIRGPGRTAQTDLFSVSGKVFNLAALPPPDPNAPVAVNDPATTTQDIAVDVVVLANDTSIPPVTVELPVILAPRNGTAVLNPDNTVTYTPNPGFFGTDSFGYRINAGGTPTLFSNVATVTVQVNAIETITVTRALANTRRATLVNGPRWNVHGTGTPGTNISIFLGPVLTGEFIGSATVNRGGRWKYTGRTPVALPVTATSVSVSSSAGGTLLNQPLDVN